MLAPGIETDGKQENPCEIRGFEGAEGGWRQAGDKKEAASAAIWPLSRATELARHGPILRMPTGLGPAQAVVRRRREDSAPRRSSCCLVQESAAEVAGCVSRQAMPCP